MFKTFEELNKEFYPESERYDKLVKSGDPSDIREALMYYRQEVEKTLSELEAYFGIERYRPNEGSKQKDAA